MRRAVGLTTVLLSAVLLASCAGGTAAPGESSSTRSTSTRSTPAEPNSTDASGTTSVNRHETKLSSTLRVAITFDQPGVGLREGDSYSGLDVDVARYIAAYLDIPRVSFIEAVTDQRITLLDTGQADLVIAAYSMTPQRARHVTFAGPYLHTGQDLLVAEDSTVRAPGQLRGSTLCSVAGSSSTSELVNDHPGLHLIERPKVSDCVDALVAGTVEAVTSDAAILAGYAAESKAPDRLKLARAPFANEEWGIAMGRAETDLCEDVSDALAQMVSSGAWKQAVEDNLGPAPLLGARTHTPPKPQACPAPRASNTSSDLPSGSS